MTGLLLAAYLALAPQAQTPLSGSSDPRIEADFRCYTAAVVMAGLGGEDEEILQAASLVAFYYLGKLEGRQPEKNWIRLGIDVGNAHSQQMLGELERCGAEFEAKSRQMITEGSAGA